MTRKSKGWSQAVNRLWSSSLLKYVLQHLGIGVSCVLGHRCLLQSQFLFKQLFWVPGSPQWAGLDLTVSLHLYQPQVFAAPAQPFLAESLDVASRREWKVKKDSIKPFTFNASDLEILFKYREYRELTVVELNYLFIPATKLGPNFGICFHFLKINM